MEVLALKFSANEAEQKSQFLDEQVSWWIEIQLTLQLRHTLFLHVFTSCLSCLTNSVISFIDGL